MTKEIEIPEGYEARIEGNKVIFVPKESDDERIRKAIGYAICAATHQDGTLINDVTREEALTYLEKQKEHEPINESNMHEPTLDEARKWNEAYEKGYSLGYENGRNEQKPAQWSEEDEQNLNVCLSYINDETLSQWLKDAVHIRYNKQAEWSEEDERIMDNCIEYIKASCLDAHDLYECIAWLQSPRPQSHWKPSEEQMEQLKSAAGLPEFGPMVTTRKQFPDLGSLYNDLKQL